MGKSRKQKFGFVHVTFEMSLRNLRGHVGWSVEYVHLREKPIMEK